MKGERRLGIVIGGEYQNVIGDLTASVYNFYPCDGGSNRGLWQPALHREGQLCITVTGETITFFPKNKRLLGYCIDKYSLVFSFAGEDGYMRLSRDTPSYEGQFVEFELNVDRNRADVVNMLPLGQAASRSGKVLEYDGLDDACLIEDAVTGCLFYFCITAEQLAAQASEPVQDGRVSFELAFSRYKDRNNMRLGPVRTSLGQTASVYGGPSGRSIDYQSPAGFRGEIVPRNIAPTP